MGIPVGPDHSRVIAEIVLAAVDKEFLGDSDDALYLRHVDDIWIGGDSVAECESRLHDLRRALNEFSLDINEHKTRIVRTSKVVSENWPYDLEAQLETALTLDKSIYEGRIVSLLGSVIEHASDSNDDGVIKFFLRKLDAWNRWDNYWNLLEPFLAHCAIQFPHSLDYVAQIIAWRRRTFGQLDDGLWGNVARKVVRSAATTGRDSEAVWGLWLAKELDVPLSATSFNQLASNTNALVCAFLVSFEERGRVTGRVRLSELWDKIEPRALTGATWPLALQLHHLRVRKPRSVSLDGPEAARAIFADRCSIIDWDAWPAAFVGDDGQIENEPHSALRFVGSGYDSDEDEDLAVPF